MLKSGPARAILAVSKPPGNNMWQGAYCEAPSIKASICSNCRRCMFKKPQIVWSVLVAEQYFHNAKTIRVISGPAAVQSLVYPEGDRLGIAGTQPSCKITFAIFAQILSWFTAEIALRRTFQQTITISFYSWAAQRFVVMSPWLF